MTLEKDFPTAIEKDLGAGAYKKGLQALKAADRSLIKPGNARRCHGSADIDSSLAARQSQASRWDYVIAHEQTLHFVEVHPAHTSEVSQVIKKKEWLMAWLTNAETGKLDAPRRFHWVASGKVARILLWP
ncbi:MAG TPA: hypothetical protein DHU56_02740 [Marinobacter sp.]|jgi:hypothetical protein|nr:hypothetical protein [Marinobacter sp.]